MKCHVETCTKRNDISGNCMDYNIKKLEECSMFVYCEKRCEKAVEEYREMIKEGAFE